MAYRDPPPHHVSIRPPRNLGRYFLYQAAALVVAAAVTLAVRALHGAHHLRWGRLGAPSRRIAWLGVGDGESLLRLGTTFAVLTSVVTGTFLYLSYSPEFSGIPASTWLLALACALPLSASNAFVEELITRWAVIESMPGRYARLAPLVSAAILGSVHHFGIPGGPVGVVMAGFLAWLLARSIQDCVGIGWAWLIHCCQDILILTVTLALFL